MWGDWKHLHLSFNPVLDPFADLLYPHVMRVFHEKGQAVVFGLMAALCGGECCPSGVLYWISFMLVPSSGLSSYMLPDVAAVFYAMLQLEPRAVEQWAAQAPW